MYYTIAGIVFFASFAMSVQLGIWSNLITLVAVIIGGLAAFGLHQPLTVMLDEQTGGSYTYLFDILVLWVVFALVTGLIKEIAGLLSRNRVNFPDQVDNFGGAGVGLLVAYAVTAFAMATLHAAPLSYDAFGGAYQYGVTPAEAKSSLDEKFALAPDVAWLRLTKSALSPEALGGAGFSPEIFISEHGRRRQKFQSLDVSIVRRS
jgi:hypothetical protein